MATRYFLYDLPFGERDIPDSSGSTHIYPSYTCDPELEYKCNLACKVDNNGAIAIRLNKVYANWNCLAAALVGNRKLAHEHFSFEKKNEDKPGLLAMCCINFNATFYALWLLNNFQFRNKGFSDWASYPRKHAIFPFLYWHCAESADAATFRKCDLIMTTFKEMDKEFRDMRRYNAQTWFKEMMASAHPVFNMIRATFFNKWRLMMSKEGSFTKYIEGIYAKGVMAIQNKISFDECNKFFSQKENYITAGSNRPILWGTW